MINMENKYYPLKIEDFTHNLEVEILNEKTNEWIKGEIDLKSSYSLLDVLDLVRVKYLDKEDIEELGFSIKETSTLRGFKYVGIEKLEDGLWCESMINISVRKFLDGTIIPHASIYSYEIHDPEKLYSPGEMKGIKRECLFRGFIKNKSELKKLLKQLNIN